MAGPYTGAWRNLNSTPYVNPNLTGSVPDTHHVKPETEDNVGWQQSTASLGYPLLDNSEYTTDYVSDGPGSTEPLSHDFGVGTGAGWTEAEGMAESEAVHNQDYGTVAENRIITPVTRDGTYHVDINPEPTFLPGSPGTLELHQTARPEVSPNARRATVTKRWFDRIFDYRRFEVDHRPRYVRTAYQPSASDPVVNGNQYTSPYPTAVTGTLNNQYVVPPDPREVPPPWDESFNAVSSVGQSDFGFFSGGL